MRDIELLQKEINEAVGMRARLGSPEHSEDIKCPQCNAALRLWYNSIALPAPGVEWPRYSCPVCGYDFGPSLSVMKVEIKIGEPVAIPIEDGRLQDLLDKIAEQERSLQQLREEIARLETKAGIMTDEERASLARLDSLIEEERAKVRDIEGKIPPVEARIAEEKSAIADLSRRINEKKDAIGRLTGQIGTWNTRIEAARILETKMYQQTTVAGWAGNEKVFLAEYETFKSLWGDLLASFYKYKIDPDVADYYGCIYGIYIEQEGISYPVGGYKGTHASPVEYQFEYHRRPPYDIPLRDLMDRVVGYANGKIAPLQSELNTRERELAGLEAELSSYTSALNDLQAQLRDLQDDLERANRRLWDAIAAKERAELEIRRAIALRQAEVDAAKARYELELRTLENLKAAYDVLLKEIELAKLEAIAEAARQREEVFSVKEKERLALAEQQRILAESLAALAEEAVGLEREEFLEKMRIALQIAEEAQEAAIATAKEKEDIAKEIAVKKAELARLELELEESRKTLGITAEKKEEAEKKVAGIPTMPWWGWLGLGLGGVATVGGIAYSAKKKK